MNELKEAKRIVLEWEPHKECGFAVSKDFLKRLNTMRLVAENCAYWRSRFTEKYIAESNWNTKLLHRYCRFVQYKMNKK